MIKSVFWASALLIISFTAASQSKGEKARKMEKNGKLVSLYFNLYTDSIKPVMDYYVNVEGQYENGIYRPLDTNSIWLTADQGTMAGNAWIMDATAKACEKVTFTATSKAEPQLKASITVYLRKGRDAEDERIMSSPKGDGK